MGLNVDNISSSLVGQWFHCDFSMDATKNSMILTSLECATSQQHNGTSPVLIRRLVLVMEL